MVCFSTSMLQRSIKKIGTLQASYNWARLLPLDMTPTRALMRYTLYFPISLFLKICQVFNLQCNWLVNDSTNSYLSIFIYQKFYKLKGHQFLKISMINETPIDMLL